MADSEGVRRTHPLVRYARTVLEAVVCRRGLPPVPDHPVMAETAAAFVTLRTALDLRGCVGDTSARHAVGEVVRDMTRAAATADPRFPPVTVDELPDIVIEISKLLNFATTDPESVVPGKHGVFVRRGPKQGLLLPQVAVELECDAFALLSLACRKAGLPPDAWRDPDVAVTSFEAEIFSE